MRIHRHIANFWSTISIAITLFFAALVGLDIHYRSVATTHMTSLRANLHRTNWVYNYFEIYSTFQTHALTDPGIRSSAFYVRDQRKAGSSEWPRFEPLHISAPGSSTHLSGFFTYRSDFVFDDADFRLSFRYQDPGIWWTILLLFLTCLLLSMLMAWLASLFDLDRQRQVKTDFAVAMTGRAVHFVKTHIHYANELYKWLVELSKNQSNPDLSEILDGFRRSQIEMEGIRSIMRLGTYSKPASPIDVKGITNLLVDAYQRPNVEIRTYFHHSSLVPIDRDVFIATAGNLIKNACDYSQGLVWIKTEEDSQYLRIIISNTGRHLKRRDIASIMKGEHSIEGESGLGLSICQVWTRKIDGRMLVDSHRGANTFQLMLPLADASPEIKERDTDPCNHTRAQQDGRSIVVLEDIPSFRRAIASEIRKSGLAVEEFSSAASFFDYFERHWPDVLLIIVDRHLSGFDAVRDRFVDACRHFDYQGPIILYTGDLSPSHNKNAQNSFSEILFKGPSIDWQKVINKHMKPDEPK